MAGAVPSRRQPTLGTGRQVQLKARRCREKRSVSAMWTRENTAIPVLRAYNSAMEFAATSLLRYPLPALLGPDSVHVWLAAGSPLEVKTGQILFHLGSPGSHAYLLLEGKIRVIKISSSGKEASLGVFQPGQLFGEYALLPPHKNTATCRVAEPSRLLQLPLNVLREQLTPILATTPLKNWLRLHALLGYLREEAFLGIQNTGLLDDRWCFLRSGEANQQTATMTRALKKGDCFGEDSLLGGRPAATVQAVTDCRLWTLSRERFLPPLRGGDEASLLQTKHTTVQAPHRPCEFCPQVGPNDCGVAALTMAARHLGLSVTPEQVGTHISLSERGTNLQAVAAAARRLGLQASSIRIGPAQLSYTRFPAVAHCADGHFVTFFLWQENGLVVGDPASGIKSVPVPELVQRWSGHLLLLSRT